MSGNQDEPCCATMEPLLHALLDGELDAANALRCEAHVKGCERCAAELAAIRATREVLQRDDRLRYRAPEGLRARVLAAVEGALPAPGAAADDTRDPAAAAAAAPAWLRQPLAVASAAVAAAVTGRGGPRRWPWWRRRDGLPALALAAGLAAGALLVVVPPALRPGGGGIGGGAASELRRDVVASHVRSLLADGHLMDVGSSARHTVKPWFAGRLDFSPPVPDLADAGFPLAGGRLDYLDGRAVAALVYRRRAHVINLFVWPDPAARRSAATPRAEILADAPGDRGHSVVRWSQEGMEFWAVSDLNAAELADFARLFQERATASPTPS